MENGSDNFAHRFSLGYIFAVLEISNNMC